ncbi:hypothetical protein H2248_010797 [Termitomyces sp. 'cryptogamus']|nr:hypothetical protein H2248_010797 [Termitomyces sp. 'cryptogamus']
MYLNLYHCAMAIDLLEVTTPGLVYICLGGFVVAFSMFLLLVKETFYLNEVVFGTAFGIAIGPHGADIFDPRSWDFSTTFITREITRIVLATGLFAIGVELPKSYMAKHGKSLLVMVVPTMAIGWLIVAGILFGLFPKLSFYSCLAISACLTPTDPIICAAIVGGKYAERHVPLNLRRILSAESAANDGLAYPFLTISLYLILDKTKQEAILHQVLVGWLYQVVMGIVIGVILGLMFSHLMKFSHQRGFIDRESYIAQYLALAIFIAGVVSTIGSDDLLAAFAAGSAISWDGEFNDHTEGEAFASILDLVLNCACFIYIGAWLPFESFNSPEIGITPWRLVILFLIILALRRIPAIMVLYRWVPEIRTWREALFSGHFGPVSLALSAFHLVVSSILKMGVGAIFISSLALHKLPAAHNPPKNEQELLAASLEPMVAFIVLCSIVIHGLSIPFLSLGKATLYLTSRTHDWMIGNQHASAIISVNPTSVNQATSMPRTSSRSMKSGSLQAASRMSPQ